jgi:2-oxoisovalerate dehydrogenase E1 component
MPQTAALASAVPWIELSSTQTDWDAADGRRLGSMLTYLHLIRAFEERALDLAKEGLVNGPVHSSIGQEGGAVGSILALRASDHVNGSHRGHHQFLAKGLTYLTPGGMDPRAPFSTDVVAFLRRTLAEIMGLAEGFCGGRGGSMHLRWAEAGALGTNGIVGGGVPLAAGAAMAHKRAGAGDLAATYFGDGATNIGSVLETMNLAAAWKLPLLFFIENNHYAVSTSVDEATAEARLSARGLGFGIPAWRVDGMDPLAVLLATEQAVARIRSGAGPAILEADLYRYFHQSGPLRGSAFGYRTKQEEEAWRARDPLDRAGRELVRRGLLSSADVDALRRRAVEAMAAIAGELTEPIDGNKRRVRPSLWPRADFCDTGIRGALPDPSALRVCEQASYPGRLADRKFVEVIADTLGRRMELDPSIVVLGEDVHRLGGGTNGATRGLKERFPDRILGTPISENAFFGLGAGLALDGRVRPVVEFMYADFFWVAGDQVFNQAGKARHMYGGTTPVPLVLRTKVAAGSGYGSQHCNDPAGIFALAPGWRILAPSTPFDYVGLMNSALTCSDPVLVMEHVELYQATMPAPADDLDYFIPIGKAAVRRQGERVTVLAYLSMVQRTLDAVARLGVDAEVIDLRTLDRAGMDWETLGESIRKTNRVLVVEQGALGSSWGGWLVDELQRRFFDWLDHPIERVTGAESAPTISKVLEQAALAGTDDVVEGLRRVLALPAGEPAEQRESGREADARLRAVR